MSDARWSDCVFAQFSIKTIRRRFEICKQSHNARLSERSTIVNGTVNVYRQWGKDDAQVSKHSGAKAGNAPGAVWR